MKTQSTPAEALPDDDAALAARIAARDESAFEALMRRHNRMLYRLARAILRDDDEAEDALQDAYLAAYRAIGSFRGGARLSTWLARIVMNAAYARRRKRPPIADVVTLHGDADTPSDDSTETSAMRAELRALLMRKIDELPEQFRIAYVLREVEEQSVEDVATILDLSPATVRSRAFRARALLRESIAREIDMATVDAFEFAGARCDRIVRAVLAHIHDNPQGGIP